MTGWVCAAFEPSTVAVVGASPTPGKLGHVVMRNVIASFAGEIVPVHPRATEVLGWQAVRSLHESGVTAELAVVCTPPEQAEAVLADCAIAGVKVAALLSGGFAETGPAGRARQERVAAVARAGGVRLVGPNSFGLVNAHRGLNASIGLGLPRPGGVSLFTHSGAYGMLAYQRSEEDAMGFAKVLSAGNTADLDAVDALLAFGADPQTRVVALVLEQLGDGRRLFEAAAAVAATKPVVALKTGASRAGRRAAAGHTGALASDAALARAALRQAGVRVVDDGETLFDVAFTLARQPAPRGRRVGVVTNSGGTGVELADRLEAEGLAVPALSEALSQWVAATLPDLGSATNPVDLTTEWRRFADLYGGVTRELLASTEIDAVVPVLVQRAALDPAVGERLALKARQAAEAGVRKPVLVCWSAPRQAEPNRLALCEAGVPCLRGTAQTARVLAGCVAPPRHARPTPDAAPPELAEPRDVTPDEAGWLPLPEALRVAHEAFGLPVAAYRVATTADEAAAAAEVLGDRVALKAVRAGLEHKTDGGGLALDRVGAAAAREAFAALVDRLGPGPVVVQRQVPAGLELMLGAVRDPQFGPVIGVGLGGIWVEALEDIVWRLAPVGSEEAADMLAELRGSRLLDGWRGQPAVPREALARHVARVSAAFDRAPWCDVLELNPLIAGHDEITAVDARVRVGPRQTPREDS